jgi:adenosylcobinamide kinase / adenosylcobinamide-phosphate guanylyltransferase
MGKKLTFILGGARSGKSTYAQNLVETGGLPALFVATATAFDDEMAMRIKNHQASRPAHWRTLEAPTHVGEALRAEAATDWVLLDCLTLLANNVLFGLPEPVDEAEYGAAMDREIDELLAVYSTHPGEWVIVSNEVGRGLVPPYPLGRIYRDALGRANQRIAAAADEVLFLVAGIPMTVKSR